MTFYKIVVAGASGTLGARILRDLLKSSDQVFQVTVLTRPRNKNAELFLSAAGLPLSSPNKHLVVSVKYDDHPALVQALMGRSLACIGGSRGCYKTDHSLPVHTGYTTSSSTGTIQDEWPNAFPVLAAQQYKMLAEAGGPTSYTCILTSMFLDVFLETALFGVYDIRGQKATLVDDGTAFFTACSTDFIAASVVAVLKLPEEATKNKRIPIAEVRTTGNELVKAIEEVFGIKMNVQHKSSDQMRSERRNALAVGDSRTAYAVTVTKLAGDGSGPGDLIDGLKFDADGALIFHRRPLKELVLLVKQRIQQA